MTKSSNGKGVSPEGSCPSEVIREICTSGNESVVNEVSTLLINALREGDGDSRSALRQFFGLPMMSQPQSQSHGAEIDRVLISRVRLFINGTNANCLQTWITSYETSAPYSQRRSILENILQAFVESESELESMKSQLADARKLSTDALSKSATLIRLLENTFRSF